VLTHYDADHVGGLAAIKSRTGARVAIHELDAPVVMKKEPPGARVPLLVRLIYRWFQPPVTPERLLKDGDVVGGLRVVHVPGHTAGSIALVRDDGAVFSGDALVTDKHGNVLPPDRLPAEDPDLAAASAGRIQALHPRPLLPGHGTPSSETTRAAVKR
jgi:hydroxyacylglutathione hydrolase